MRYHWAKLAFDNDLTTAWFPQKGAAVGEWIQVQFKQPTVITSISIYGGYGLGVEPFKAHNRVQQLRLSFPNGFTRILKLEDEPIFQRFELPMHPVLSSIKFEILSVYPGAKYNLTPISEIKFNEPATP
jgi:hypothetical protein